MAKYYLAPLYISYPNGVDNPPQIDPGRLNSARDGVIDLYADPAEHPFVSGLDLMTENLVFPAHKLTDPNQVAEWDIPFRSETINRLPESDYMVVMTRDGFRETWANELGWEQVDEGVILGQDENHDQAKSRLSSFLDKWNHNPEFFRGVQ